MRSALSTPFSGQLLRPTLVQRCCQSAGTTNAGLPGVLPCLQRKRDAQPAKGVTAAEWRDVLKSIKEEMARRLTTKEGADAWKKATGGDPVTCHPIYSFDNCNSHVSDSEALRELGLMDEKDNPTAFWLPLPTYSGDLHRTIERVHARICGAFKHWLDDDTQEYCVEGYAHMLCYFFLKTQTSTVITKCMSSISDLYQQVVDLGGGIPPARYR